MKKAIAALLCLAFSAPAILAEPLETKLEAVVRLECQDGMITGSAVHIGGGRYVSVAHVVDPTCKLNGEGISVTYRDEGQDFATFNARPIAASLAYTCKDFKAKEMYYAVGYGFGWPTRMTEPWIASNIKFGGFRHFVGEAIPGMSGGAVIDGKGTVVGVVNMRWPARSMALHDTPLCKKGK